MTFVGCANNDTGTSTSDSGAPLVSFCLDPLPVTDPITVTGNANFYYRQDGNGAIAGPSSIRFAEIRVINSAGTVVQCGKTDAAGDFSVQVQKNSGSHTLFVTSRSSGPDGNVYIMNNPDNNQFHSLNTTFSSTANSSTGTLTAHADGDLLGGAFNIMDQILQANTFLQAQTLNCDTTFPGCENVTSVPLVKVYWMPGFNPGSYFGFPDSGLSFFLPDEKELYILGGINGDVLQMDTDHFDNSIILHEYAHFLESTYSRTDSPGGSHTGNEILDPRLAWGEGWANFFQAAITGNPVYRDTTGNIDGFPGLNFNEDLEVPQRDIAAVVGEGNFREFSITRLLWDSFDTANEGAGVDEVSNAFAEFWAAFTKTSGGMKDNSVGFRASGLLYEFRNLLPGSSDWTSLFNGEGHLPDSGDYGGDLIVPGTCDPIFIQAKNAQGKSPENGMLANSNMFDSNDFYFYSHPGGTISLGLSYTTNPSIPADVDLMVWSEGYNFTDNNLSDRVAVSSNDILVGSGSGTESIATNLPPGKYLINVHVHTGVRLGAPAFYSLTLNGQSACPE